MGVADASLTFKNPYIKHLVEPYQLSFWNSLDS